MKSFPVFLALAALAGPWSVAAGAEDCARPSPEATWEAFLEASTAPDPVGSARCMTRALQVETATDRTVAIDMAIATLEIVGAAGHPEGAGTEAARLRRELEGIYARNGIAEVMAEVREPLRELAWDGNPELVDDDVERRIAEAIERSDPLRLIADLWSYVSRRLSSILEAEGESAPVLGPMDALENLTVEGALAHGRASGEIVRFRRVDGLWYLEEKPSAW